MRKIILLSFLIVLGLVITIVCIQKHRSPNHVTYFEPAISEFNNTWGAIANGLRCRVVSTGSSVPFSSNISLPFWFEIQNASTNNIAIPIKFYNAQGNMAGLDIPFVFQISLNNVWIGSEKLECQTGIDRFIELKPNEIARFPFVFTEDSTIQQKIIISKGTYKCRMKFGGKVYPYEIYSNNFDLHIE